MCALRAILRRVGADSVLVNLAIDLESDPISGVVTRCGGEPRRFSGWIDLVAVIEQERGTRRKGENTRVDAWGEPTPGRPNVVRTAKPVRDSAEGARNQGAPAAT